MEELNRIISRIEEDYKKEIEKIINDAEEEASKIKGEYEERAKRIREEIIENARKEAEKEREKIISLAKLEARRIISETKNSIIEEVIKKSIERLRNIDKNTYRNFLRKVLSDSLKLLNSNRIEIKARESDMDIISDIVKEFGIEAKISNIEQEILGGVLVKDLNSNIELNFTFEKILERKIDRIRTEIAKILFS